MKMTPLDIYQRVFKKTFRGYDVQEVDEFIKAVGKEYEQLFAQNRGLKDEVARLKEQMKDYIELEKTLKQALISAQKTSGEIKSTADKQAELIIKQAEINADKLIEDARLEAKDIMNDIRNLKTQQRKLRRDLKNLLDSYYEILNEEPEKKQDQKPA